MTRISFWLQRVMRLLIVLLLVTFGVSLLLRLIPVDLADVLLPQGSAEERDAFRTEIGLDKGMVGYYLQWLGNFVQGDFGKVYFAGGTEEVFTRVAIALPRSLLLMIYTQVFALAISIPLGVISAYRAGRRADRIISNSLFIFSSVPSFAIALTLMIVVGVQLKWLPALGYATFSEGIWEHLKHMIMPVVSLGLGLIAVYTRLLRADMISTLREDYVTMAVSKGLSDKRILWRHVFRPSSLTLFTSAALNMGGLIGGAIVIESIFATYGMGYGVFAAIAGRQYVELQSMVALIALFYVFFNLVVDVGAEFVDPRTRDRKLNA